MKIGNLNNVIMESTYDYINSIRLDENDPVVLLGEVALHKTLEYEDTSYLWEFALNEEKWDVYTHVGKDDKGNPIEVKQYNDPENNNDRVVFDDMKTGHRLEYIRSKTRSTRDDILTKFDTLSKTTEKDFNSYKNTTLEKYESQLSDLNNMRNIAHVDDVKKIKSNMEGFRDFIKNKEFPKSWLAKKIAWFRSLYEKFMIKNKYAKEPGVIGWIKHILACIAKIIDMLLAKLQHAVN